MSKITLEIDGQKFELPVIVGENEVALILTNYVI
jgi:hypothetical protein